MGTYLNRITKPIKKRKIELFGSGIGRNIAKYVVFGVLLGYVCGVNTYCVNLSQPNNKKKENEKLTAKNKEKRFMCGCLCMVINAQKYQKVALWHYL